MLRSWAIALSFALAFTATTANAQLRFGWDGSDGRDGFSGQNGQSGQDITVFADGSAQNFMLNGTDGSPGARGEPGQDAWGCTQDRRDHDERGADGGDGGDGGRGGNGGSGGNLDIYYTDIGHLKSIRVEALPGRGSMGGSGSYGGRGCYCTWRSWSETKCRIVKNPDGTERKECWYENYSCWDGMNGRPGMMGSNGSHGQMGRALLIPSATQVQPDDTYDSRDVSLLNGYMVTLAKNNYVQKSGLLSMLAPGSQLQDTYDLWTGRDVKTASVKWSASRQAADFKGIAADFKYSTSGIQMNMPMSLMSLVTSNTQGANTDFNVMAVVPRAEAEGVKFAFEGTGYDTIVRVLDPTLEPQLLTDNYNIKLYRDRFGGDDLNWEGDLTPEYMGFDGKNVILKIGKLPAKDADKTFKPGKDIKVVFNLTRKLGTATATVKTDKVEYKLPKKK